METIYSKNDCRVAISEIGIMDIETWHYGNNNPETKIVIQKIITMNPLVTEKIFDGSLERLVNLLSIIKESIKVTI